MFFLCADVAFGILTAKNLVQSRVHAQQLSWLPQARDVVFYSEADLEALQPTVVRAPAGEGGVRAAGSGPGPFPQALEPPPKEELVGGGAWKNFPARASAERVAGRAAAERAAAHQ